MMVPDLLEALGGAAKVADNLGLKRGAVAMWGTRGLVPREHHLAVWALCMERRLPWEPPGADAIRAQLAPQPQPAKVA
jgi:hypothetical protein